VEDEIATPLLTTEPTDSAEEAASLPRADRVAVASLTTAASVRELGGSVFEPVAQTPIENVIAPSAAAANTAPLFAQPSIMGPLLRHPNRRANHPSARHPQNTRASRYVGDEADVGAKFRGRA
jgi:hypothetical protein